MIRITFAAAVLAIVGLTGCSKQEQAEAGNKTEQAARDAGAAIKNAGSSLNDGGITMKVKSAMSLSGKLDTSKIDVDTRDKVVYLRGAAANSEQSALAERIARDTVAAGVKVINELKIGPQQKKR